MKYLFFFTGLFFIAATVRAQDTKVTELPPVRTVDNVQPQLQKTGIMLPVLTTAGASVPKPVAPAQAVPVLATANAAAPKTATSAQAVPLRTADIAAPAQPAPGAAKAPDGSAPAKAAAQPPSSIPVAQATAQGQKQDNSGKAAQ